VTVDVVEGGGRAGRDDVGAGVPTGTDAGTQHARLAATRRADDGNEGMDFEPLDEVGHDSVATEVALRVLGAERDEAGVGALGAGRGRVDAGSRQGEHLLALAATPELGGTEVDE